MDWYALLPKHIAQRQIAWERRHSMLRAVNAGATQAEIAKHLGLSRAVISVHVRIAARQQGRQSPAEKFLEPQKAWKSDDLTPDQFRERLEDVKRRKEEDRQIREAFASNCGYEPYSIWEAREWLDGCARKVAREAEERARRADEMEEIADKITPRFNKKLGCWMVWDYGVVNWVPVPTRK